MPIPALRYRLPPICATNRQGRADVQHVQAVQGVVLGGWLRPHREARVLGVAGEVA